VVRSGTGRERSLVDEQALRMRLKRRSGKTDDPIADGLARLAQPV